MELLNSLNHLAAGVTLSVSSIYMVVVLTIIGLGCWKATR